MKKILLLEGDTTLSKDMSNILRLANYEVEVANNGKFGLETAYQNIPDLIICDLNLPELDGMGLLRILSRHAEFNLVPFLFISKDKSLESIRRIMDMGADDFIINPVDHTELLRTVDIHIMKMEKVKASFHRERTQNETSFDSFLKTPHTHKKYKKKQMIFQTGDKPNFLYYIAQGKAKSFIENEEGKEVTVTLYVAGDFIGTSALLAKSPYAANAMALEDLELVLIPKEEFTEIMSNDSALSHDILLRLKNANTLNNERLLKFAYDSARKRVADSLLFVSDKFSSGAKCTPINRDRSQRTSQPIGHCKRIYDPHAH
jgi:CRP/FNR family cyclic AMP-dependent transcriptional regulator